MKVAEFMTPADKVITSSPFETIRKVMDLMLAHKVVAIVIVQDNERKEGKKVRACGIITKSDILEAYHYSHISIDHPCLEIMSSGNLGTCNPEMSLDEAARDLTKNHNHHAIVVDHDQRFVGVLSTWDITVACSEDHQSEFDAHQEEENKNPRHHTVQEKQANTQRPDRGPFANSAGPPRPRAKSERQAGRSRINTYHTRSMSDGQMDRPKKNTDSSSKSKTVPVGRPGLDFSAGTHHDPHLHNSFCCYMEDLGLMLSLE